jgi:hypothetical protein
MLKILLKLYIIYLCDVSVCCKQVMYLYIVSDRVVKLPTEFLL